MYKIDRNNCITMFGGASDSVNNDYKAVIYELFKKIADAGLALCFGGGSTGMMGEAARGYKSSFNNKFLYGVAPVWMSKFEPLYEKCDKIEFTPDMEERKRILRDMSKAYIVCPGGQGTIEEWALCSVARQLQTIPEDSRIILFNYNGFYDDFIVFLKAAVDKGFLSQNSYETTIVCNTVDEVLSTVYKLYNI